MELFAIALIIAVLGTLYLANRVLDQRQQVLDVQFSQIEEKSQLNNVPEVVNNNDFLQSQITALQSDLREYKLVMSIRK